MSNTADVSPEMRLLSPDGQQLYLTTEERERFLQAAKQEAPDDQMFCQVLHYTGCRPSEALELTPARILIDDQSIVFRSLKKRKTDNKGRIKQPQNRSIPVPKILIDHLDLVFNLRFLYKRKKRLNEPLCCMSRPTAYRLVKRAVDRAGIKGKQATGKGLRHGFVVAMATAKKPLPLHVLSQLWGTLTQRRRKFIYR